MLWTRIVAGVGAALMMALAVPTPAAAVDDYLVASEPAARQELKAEPGWVTLAFRTKANAKLAKILVLDADGRNVTSGALIVEGTNVTTQLAFDLPKGTYTVMYRTSGADGRVRGGSFQFAYGKGTWSQSQKEVWIGEEEQPPVLANPDPNATSTPTATPTTSASEMPTPSTGGSGTPGGPSFSTTPEPTGSGDGSVAVGWFVAGGVLLLGAAGAGVWLARRRRS
ncbi:hypothetical protein PROP_00414 [Propionicimonas sp. T2.31MG-18]|uniref:copper resistance CopC family protein n=1 Tax=Propionicimonas sp. T2.31MG-18 TaxID=3157620 RepID=UPI0035E78357